MYAGLLLSVKDKYNSLVLVHLSNALYILFLHLPKLHSVRSTAESYHIKHMDCMDIGDGIWNSFVLRGRATISRVKRVLILLTVSS